MNAAWPQLTVLSLTPLQLRDNGLAPRARVAEHPDGDRTRMKEVTSVQTQPEVLTCRPVGSQEGQARTVPRSSGRGGAISSVLANPRSDEALPQCRRERLLAELQTDDTLASTAEAGHQPAEDQQRRPIPKAWWAISGGQATNAVSPSDIAFHTQREYNRGNDLRNVPRKSSAKIRALIVRQYNDTRPSHADVLLSVDPSEYADQDELELGNSCAAPIGLAALHDDQTLTVIVGESVFATAGPTRLLTRRGVRRKHRHSTSARCYTQIDSS